MNTIKLIKNKSWEHKTAKTNAHKKKNKKQNLKFQKFQTPPSKKTQSSKIQIPKHSQNFTNLKIQKFQIH